MSTSPPVMCPAPLAVIEPTTVLKPLLLYPLRMQAYCPLRTDSFPDSQTVGSARLMFMLSPRVALFDAESITSTVKLKEPRHVFAGLPLMNPVVELRDRQVGSAPPLTMLHVYTPVPPVAFTETL